MTADSKCPKCNVDIVERDEAWPFCSKRCRDADLTSWFTEEYCLTRELADEDLSDPKIAQAFVENLGTLDPYDPRFS